MSLPPLQLRPATSADAVTAMRWTPTEYDLKLWAGPRTRLPATPETFWADINNADATSFVLEHAVDGTVAFGQVRFRLQKYGHLARLIVAPSQRGRGVGRALCRELMQATYQLYPAFTEFSLYVYPENKTAITLYESLGFVDRGPDPDFANCHLMIAPRESTLMSE